MAVSSIRLYRFYREEALQVFYEWRFITKGKAFGGTSAAEYAAGKRELKSVNNISFGDALDKYITMREPVLSPSSIKKYKKMRHSSAQMLMEYKISDISQDVIQSVINEEEKITPQKVYAIFTGWFRR